VNTVALLLIFTSLLLPVDDRIVRFDCEKVRDSLYVPGQITISSPFAAAAIAAVIVAYVAPLVQTFRVAAWDETWTNNRKRNSALIIFFMIHI
jgi:hypothetical protein